MWYFKQLARILDNWRFRAAAIAILLVLSTISIFLFPRLSFTFDFEQFFPQGDPDYEFFKSFIEEFETDDNFLLVALEDDKSAFNQDFIKDVAEISREVKSLPYVEGVTSLPLMRLPIFTPFGPSAIPVLHPNDRDKLAIDSARVMNDTRFAGKLVGRDGKAMVVYMKIKDKLELEEAQELMPQLEDILSRYDHFENHILGRANFQTQMVTMQRNEIVRSTLAAAVLVVIAFFLIYRSIAVVGLALTAIGLSFLFFMGFLCATGRPLNAMSALYPIILIIVGSSDVIHIFSKYVGEIRNGKSKPIAMAATLREIGLATLLTSVTTAIGFSSLVTSKIQPVRDFGLNAAVGVVIAFVGVTLFSAAILPMMPRKIYLGADKTFAFWDRVMEQAYLYTVRNPYKIGFAGVLVLGVSLWGMSKVSTNYRIEENLPRGEKVTEDFLYFDEYFGGFRPFEVAVISKNGDAGSWQVVKDVNALEDYLYELGSVQGPQSMATVYKSINQAYNGNQSSFYAFPEDSLTFDKYRVWIDRYEGLSPQILVNKSGDKTRISANLKDIGADSIQNILDKVDRFVATRLDTTVASYRQTGTGIMVDKNAEYVRQDLITGLGLAIGIVSILMGLLYRNIGMLLIALVPNLLPLLLSAAALGFLGVELEAGIAITFAVVFGIAVDDTIHFLSKFRLVYGRSKDLEFSLRQTFLETGKALCLTTVVLFFGFLVMLFSIHPPSQTVGVLISITLITALLGDLFILPLLIRGLFKRFS